MRLPNLERAYVPPEKIINYLLDTFHEQGRGKALFFFHLGFLLEDWDTLASALIRHAAENEVVSVQTTRFGTWYVVEGALHTPGGRVVQVRSVWFVATDASYPRLVTAYPMEELDDQGT